MGRKTNSYEIPTKFLVVNLFYRANPVFHSGLNSFFFLRNSDFLALILHWLKTFKKSEIEYLISEYQILVDGKSSFPLENVHNHRHRGRSSDSELKIGISNRTWITASVVTEQDDAVALLLLDTTAFLSFDNVCHPNKRRKLFWKHECRQTLLCNASASRFIISKTVTPTLMTDIFTDTEEMVQDRLSCLD